VYEDYSLWYVEAAVMFENLVFFHQDTRVTLH